jgi:hypothetical protein
LVTLDVAAKDDSRGRHPPKGGGKGGALLRARADLRYHRIFARALVGGWLIPDEEKRRIIVNMLTIVTAPRVKRHKNQRTCRRSNPLPTERERIQAARVLAFAQASDNAIFLRCLDELHLRERLGLEPDMWEVPTPTGAPVGPSTAREPEVIETAAEFAIPPTVETPDGTLTKELSDAALDEYVRRRHPNRFAGDEGLCQNGRP